MKKLLLLSLLLILGLPFPLCARQQKYYPTILELRADVDPEEAVIQLEKEGVIIYGMRDNMLLACLPISETAQADEAAASIRKRYGTGRSNAPYYRPRLSPNRPALDKSMEYKNAGHIFSGTGLPNAYDGKGVVVGICDTGFDPTHPAFLDADGTPGRLKMVVNYREEEGIRNVADTPEQIAALTTDNGNTYHATHVAGILAGQSAGTPYRGAAPGADLVVTTSQTTDVGLLAGAEDILRYAKSQGKPCVISISMANYTGPHDGTSPFCRYLDKIAEEAVVVISSGNAGSAGQQCVSASHTYTTAKPSYSFVLATTDWLLYHFRGAVDVWNSTSAPLKASLRLKPSSGTTGHQAVQYDAIDFSTISEWGLSSNPEDPNYNADFAAHFSGWVKLSGDVDPANGRFELAITYDATNLETVPDKSWGLYGMVFTLTGAEGVRSDIYADGVYTALRRSSPSAAPTSDGSISDIATGRNVISVGMLYNRETYPSLAGQQNAWGSGLITQGAPALASSYGTLLDGRVTPLTTAPGTPIVSAGSRFYAATHTGIDADICLHDDATGAYWMIEGGTSMSAPYVAGMLATWLQADPSLTPEQVQQYVLDSNDAPTIEETDPHHGRGNFNPLRGLNMILENVSSGCKVIGGDDSLTVTAVGLTATAASANGAKVTVTVTGVDGRTMLQLAGDGNVSADLTTLPAGFYIVTATDGRALQSRKISKF